MSKQRKAQRPKSSKNRTKRGDIARRKDRIRKLRKDWNHGEQYDKVASP